MGKLDGKVAIVTGAARGLGRAYARRLASLGAKIAVADLNLRSYEEFEAEAKDMSADSTVAEIQAAGGEALGIELDVTDRDAVEAMVARVVAEWGRVDVLVANAGGGRGRPVDTKASGLDPALLQLVVAMNLFGTVYSCNAVAPIMKEQRSGRIITVSSVAGTAPSKDGGYAHYGAAKAAIAHYTRYLAQDLGPYGITANCIAPGVIATGRIMQTVIPGSSQSNQDRAELVALRRLGTVEDCAKVVEFLATDLSDYVTGAVNDRWRPLARLTESHVVGLVIGSGRSAAREIDAGGDQCDAGPIRLAWPFAEQRDREQRRQGWHHGAECRPARRTQDRYRTTVQNNGDDRDEDALEDRLNCQIGERQSCEAGAEQDEVDRQVKHQRSGRNERCCMQRIELCPRHDHGKARRQQGGAQEERIAEAARGGPAVAPAPDMPAQDGKSARQDQRQPELSRHREPLAENQRGNQPDKQRYAARVECSLIGRRGKAQPGRRDQHIRCAQPGYDHNQAGPAQAIDSKAPPHENRCQQQAGHAKAQRRDVPRVEAGRHRKPRDRAPARPNRCRRKAERGALQVVGTSSP